MGTALVKNKVDVKLMNYPKRFRILHYGKQIANKTVFQFSPDTISKNPRTPDQGTAPSHTSEYAI